MRTRFVLSGFFILSAAVCMAGASSVSAPDWVDRMMASASAPASGPDWAERMIAAGALSGIPQPDDWADRLIADRRVDFAPRSLSEVQKVETALIQAEGARDVSAALSLFAPDAVVTSGGRTYSGVEEIRTYWESSAPFTAETRWVGDSPSYRVRIEAGRDRASLEFECVWIDSATRQARARSYANGTLVREGDHWVIESLISRTVQI